MFKKPKRLPAGISKNRLSLFILFCGLQSKSPPAVPRPEIITAGIHAHILRRRQSWKSADPLIPKLSLCRLLWQKPVHLPDLFYIYRFRRMPQHPDKVNLLIVSACSASSVRECTYGRDFCHIISYLPHSSTHATLLHHPYKNKFSWLYHISKIITMILFLIMI